MGDDIRVRWGQSIDDLDLGGEDKVTRPIEGRVFPRLVAMRAHPDTLFQAEEAECAHKFLDGLGTPRADAIGTLSLVGRIVEAVRLLDPDVPYDAIAADVLRVIVEQPTNRENNRGITGNV